MKFIISRTSDYRDHSSPCAEAKEDQVARIETRDLYCHDREMVNVWTIEIDSIEELIALSRKYGKIIITDHYLNVNDGYPTLEIYDSYRE